MVRVEDRVRVGDRVRARLGLYSGLSGTVAAR